MMKKYIFEIDMQVKEFEEYIKENTKKFNYSSYISNIFLASCKNGKITMQYTNIFGVGVIPFKGKYYKKDDKTIIIGKFKNPLLFYIIFICFFIVLFLVLHVPSFVKKSITMDNISDFFVMLIFLTVVTFLLEIITRKFNSKYNKKIIDFFENLLKLTKTNN